MTEEGVPLRWSVRVDGPLSGALNMARDEGLARLVSEAADGGAGGVDALPAFLRFYTWARPTLSLGRNEPARGRFDLDELRRAGVEVVRRPTGGRAVLHDREVTYAVVVPVRALGGPRQTYRRVNGVLATGLGALGVEAELASDTATAPLDAGPCFDLPAGGEVVAGGRKLVGSAQARLGGALLQHGSILLHDDQGRIEALARRTPFELRDRGSSAGRPVALAELLDPPPTFDAVVHAVTRSASSVLPGEWTAGGTTWAPRLEHLESGLVGRYHDADWTWRR